MYIFTYLEFIIDESKKGDLVYAVPGHPRVAEKTVGIIEDLAKQNNVEVEVSSLYELCRRYVQLFSSRSSRWI